MTTNKRLKDLSVDDRRRERTEDSTSEDMENPFAAYERHKEANRRFRKELAKSLSPSRH